MKRYFFLFTFLSLSLFWPIFLGKVNLNGNLLVSFYSPYGQNLPFKNTGWDQLRIYFPFYKVTLDSMRRFELPLWNPYAFSGHPHLADFQTAVFYPVNIFGLFLPQIEFWHLLRLTPTILASFFTFLYLRNLPFVILNRAKRGGISTIASIFGALTFGFSPFILTWGEEVVMSAHSIVWLPLILLAIDMYLAKPKRQFLALIAVSTALSLFGGYMQTSIYLFMFAFGYLWLRLGLMRLFFSFNSLKLIGAFILGVALAAVQLVPSAELYFNAARSQVALTETLFEFLLPAESLVTYLAPDFFGHPATGNFFRLGSAQYYEGIMFVGLAALIFGVLALLKIRGDKLKIFLAVFGIVALSTTLDLPSSRLLLSLPIPFLASSIANRVLFIPAFCLAILAAIGMNEWLAGKSRRIVGVILGIGLIYGFLILTLFVIKIFNLNYFGHAHFFSGNNAGVSLRNLVIPLIVFGVSSGAILVSSFVGRFKKPAVILVIIMAFSQTFLISRKYFSFSDRVNIFPKNEILEFVRASQGEYRSWGVGSAFLENNFATQYGIYWPEGYDSLNNRSYAEFTNAMQGSSLDDFVFRADAGLGRSETVALLDNVDRRKLIDMLGIKYVIARDEDGGILEKRGFRKVFNPTNNQFSVWENFTVMPRAFLASNYEGPPDIFTPGETEAERREKEKQRRKLIPQKLMNADFDWRNVIVLEKPSPISAQFGPGTAEIVSYKPQEVIIKTSSKEPKLLFLSDNFYAGWKATVDGDEVQIMRANYTFRAVPLIGGDHEVRFYFDSASFKVGLLVSGVSLAVVLLMLLKFRLSSIVV